MIQVHCSRLGVLFWTVGARPLAMLLPRGNVGETFPKKQSQIEGESERASAAERVTVEV
jgi:hypothetical protein